MELMCWFRESGFLNTRDSTEIPNIINLFLIPRCCDQNLFQNFSLSITILSRLKAWPLGRKQRYCQLNWNVGAGLQVH